MSDALFLPPPIWKTACKPNRPIRNPEPARFGLNRALMDCDASISTRSELAFKKASLMTDPSMAPEAPDVAETVSFLRRFADLMSNGYNAAHLHRAADLLKTLTARVIAASDEEQLWRYKYETLTRHADALEGECDALKHDIEGHLNVTSSILTERDALKAALQSRESEISGLRDAFDREREALKATAKVRDEEVEQLRRAFEDERGELKAAVKAGEQSLAELRIALDGERAGFQTRVKASGDELAAFHVASERERDALAMKVDALEAKRAELRSAFERISDLRIQTAGTGSSVPGKPGLEAQARPIPAQRREMDPAVKEASAVVPKTTLRQVRAQFEYLAKECIPRGDIASQVMCELGAHTMDLALTAGGETDRLPVGEVALSILSRSGPTSLATADTV